MKDQKQGRELLQEWVVVAREFALSQQPNFSELMEQTAHAGAAYWLSDPKEWRRSYATSACAMYGRLEVACEMAALPRFTRDERLDAVLLDLPLFQTCASSLLSSLADTCRDVGVLDREDSLMRDVRAAVMRRKAKVRPDGRPMHTGSEWVGRPKRRRRKAANRTVEPR